MKQILLISSNPEFIEDLSAQIERHIEGFTVVAKSDKPDLVIVDEDAGHLKDFPKVPNILLTSANNAQTNSDIIQKPFCLNDFFKSLRSIIQRFENTSEGYLYFNQYELRPGTKEILNLRNNELVKLTEREVSILKYLYKHRDQIISKNELLENVWGYNRDAATHTIETHIYRLRQKIEQDGAAPIIDTLEGGYRLKMP